MSALEDSLSRSETTDSDSWSAIDVQSRCASPVATYYFKMLIAREDSGQILGHNGATISKITEDSDAILKISPKHELFPGTNRRVLNIYGKHLCILHAIELIVKKLLLEDEIPKHFVEERAGTPTQLRPILCLIPLGLAGSVIGKGGSTIKRLAEQSGCKMQFSGSFDPHNTYERTLSFVGPTVEAILLGIRLVFECLVAHPVGISVKNCITVQLSSQTRSFATTKPLLDCYFDANAHLGSALPCPIPKLKAESVGDDQYSPTMSMMQAQQDQTALCDQAYMVFPQAYVAGYGHNYDPSTIPCSCPSSPRNCVEPFLPTGANTLEYISKYITVPVVENAKCGKKLKMTIGIDEHAIGCIIGQHGLVMQDLMNLTKTNIVVSRRGVYQPDSSFRIVTACGQLQQLQMLNALIISRLIDMTYFRQSKAQQA